MCQVSWKVRGIYGIVCKHFKANKILHLFNSLCYCKHNMITRILCIVFPKKGNKNLTKYHSQRFQKVDPSQCSSV